MSRIIEVTVSPKGFTGEACRDATRSLEAALGVRTHEQLTGEFHAAAVNTQVARQ